MQKNIIIYSKRKNGILKNVVIVKNGDMVLQESIVLNNVEKELKE